MVMKTVNSTFAISAIFIAIAFVGFEACSKSSSPSGPPPPTPLGGYVSSDSVATDALISYWNFDGSPNDTKGGITGTAANVTYTAGVRGQAYQGASNGYITFTPNSAMVGLTSYSLSVWFWQPAQPTSTPTNDPQGIFFLADAVPNPDIILENESYAPVSGDSVKLHAGLSFPASPGWQGFTMETFDTMAIGKWVFFTMTYDGPSSTYIVYQNGQPMLNSSAYGSNAATVLLQGPGGATPPSAPQGNINWSANPPVIGTIGTWAPNVYGVSTSLGANGCFLGKLDELRLFNRAITAKEVAGLFLNGQAGR